MPKRNRSKCDSNGVRDSKKRAKLFALGHHETINRKIEERHKASRANARKNVLFKCCYNPSNHEYNNSTLNSSIGVMNVLCPKGCGAKHFPNEKTLRMCCGPGGHGSYEHMHPLPDFITNYLLDKEFRKSIRHYNATLQISTIGSSLGSSGFEVRSDFPFCIRVHGSIYHSIPPVVPGTKSNPRFVQLYVIDNGMNYINRQGLDSSKMFEIMQFLLKHNPWAQAIRQHSRKYLLYDPSVPTIGLTIKNSTRRQYESPTIDEIAVFIPNSSVRFDSYRSIQLFNANGGFSTINEFHESYDPTHYVLMFPYGDSGYSSKYFKEKISPMQYYCQRLQVREKLTLGHFGRLFHEYVIDQYCKMEKARLDYIAKNQKALRFATSQENRMEESPPAHLNKNQGSTFVYLPASVKGSPRYFRQRYLNAISIASKLGGATFFITMTTNPYWPEIKNSLQHFETAVDRPDIVARVFKIKFDMLIHDLTKNHIFGYCLSHFAVTEFQKRGLPHGHVLKIIDSCDRPRTPSDVDCYVSAELPDVTKEPEYFNLVTQHMIHSCNHNCLNKEKCCSKNYPKPFLESTEWRGESLIKCRRRCNGRTFRKNNVTISNQNVVPHNKFLLLKYRCHINTLVCTTKIASIRYLFKYLTKGCDMATLRLSMENGLNEVEEYINGRYISASEAIWNLFGFGITDVSPSVRRLPITLPKGCNQAYDQHGEPINDSQINELEAFFILNTLRSQDTEDKFPLYYSDISKYYVFNVKSRQWNKRMRLSRTGLGYSLNRLDNVSINQGERFFLRILLLHVPNPKSYKDLLTYEGVEYSTFQETCCARDLLSSDEIWISTMDEATRTYHPIIVRQIFAYVLAYGQISSPMLLWSRFKNSLAEDYRRIKDSPYVTNRMIQLTILEVEKHLNDMRTSFRRFSTLSNLLENCNIKTETRKLETICYSQSERGEYLDLYKKAFNNANAEQKCVIEYIVKCLSNRTQNKLIAIAAAAGTGKTYILNSIINWCLSTYGTNGSIIVVSTTAVSAQLLRFGQTAHSTFKLPLKLECNIAQCSLPLDSSIALQLKEAKIMIWDEIFSCRWELLAGVDNFLQQLKENRKPFGGITVVISGDYRQTLPKLHRGTRQQITRMCLTNSLFFRQFKLFTLNTNMRLRNSPDNQRFANFLLDIGNGTIHCKHLNQIELPRFVNRATSIDDVIRFIYGSNPSSLSNEQIGKRTILAPLNSDVRELNSHILSLIPGSLCSYLSYDEEVDPNGDTIVDLPQESLHNIVRSGMPLHNLELKENCIVMCIRNLTREVCNGTKLVVLKLRKNIIDCKIITGPGANRIVSIPRITLTSDVEDSTIILKRRQFPLCLAYAMTIDKSQGQSLEYAGIVLKTQCFAHGQLYTAFSRASYSSNLIVYTEKNHTLNNYSVENIVWKEVIPKQVPIY